MRRLVQAAASAAGRLLLGGWFVWMATAQYMMNFRQSARLMETEGVPYLELGGRPLAHYFVAVVITLMLAGGVSVALGVKARWGAALLALAILPLMLLQHDFWNQDDLAAAQQEMASFLKDLALLGGAVWIASVGAGAGSWDALTSANLVDIVPQKELSSRFNSS